MTKTCKKCGVEKGVEGFSKDRTRSCGIDQYCKICRVSYNRDRNKKNPEKMRAWRRKHKYGVTPEQFENALREQSGVCAICSGLLKLSHVDHDHNSGKFRGILCITCNTGLGKFGDSVELLLKAVRYLQKS